MLPNARLHHRPSLNWLWLLRKGRNIYKRTQVAKCPSRAVILGGQVLLFASDPKKRGKKQDLTPIRKLFLGLLDNL